MSIYNMTTCNVRFFDRSSNNDVTHGMSKRNMTYDIFNEIIFIRNQNNIKYSKGVIKK